MLLFVTHTIPSAPGIRDWLIERLGRRVFFALHGLVSTVLLVWIILIYMNTEPDFVWAPPQWHRWAAVLIMPVALWLIAARLMLKPAEVPRGIYRICATPGSTGTLIWSLLHLMNIGHASAIAAFVAFASIAAVSVFKNWRVAPDAVRAVGPVPFFAIIAGRQQISADDISFKPLIAGLIVWVLLLTLHAPVLGVDPLIGVLR